MNTKILQKLTEKNDFTATVAKHGKSKRKSDIYYDGVWYTVTPSQVNLARRTMIGLNEVDYDKNGINKLPELKYGDEFTEWIAKVGSENRTLIFKYLGLKFRVTPRDTIRAKRIVSGMNTKTVNPKWRAAVMERDNHTCQHCGSHENLQAHHILGRAGHPEMAENVDNGILLCAECHKRFHQLYGYTGFTQTDLIKFMKFD